MMLDLSDEPDAETLYRWDLLFNAVYEDYQGVWEPYWELNGDWGQSYTPDLNAHERQVAAEAALRDLWSNGLIRFFRMGPWPAFDLNQSAEDPDHWVADKDVPGLLTSQWWRRVPLPYADVYFGPTDLGEARAAEQEHLRAKLHEASYRPQQGIARLPDLSRARRDLERGRVDHARQRLTSLLSWHGGAYQSVGEVLDALGEIEFDRARLAAAGRYWCLTGRDDAKFELAFAAFRLRWGDDPYQLWRQVSRLLFGRPLPDVAAKRIREWERRALPDPPSGWRSNVRSISDKHAVADK